MRYRITSIKDLNKLSKKYDDNQLFKIEETWEEMTLPDLKFFFDVGRSSDYTISTIES